MSHLPPLRHPDETIDQYSQSDMSSTAEIRKLSYAETGKVHSKFPVTPLPIRGEEYMAEENDSMKVTDTLPSSSWLNSSGLLSFLNHGSGSNATSSSNINSGSSRKTSRYSNDPTVGSKTTFASCIVEVRDMTFQSILISYVKQFSLTYSRS